MKGTNVIRLNEAMVKEAFHYWLTNRFFRNDIGVFEVTTVRKESPPGSGFEVTVITKEDQKPGSLVEV